MIAQQIRHRRGPQHFGAAERQSANRPELLLELARQGAFDGPRPLAEVRSYALEIMDELVEAGVPNHERRLHRQGRNGNLRRDGRIHRSHCAERHKLLAGGIALYGDRVTRCHIRRSA